jgi:hypothetical protein
MAVDVGAAAPSGGLVSRGGGLEDHVGQLLHGVEKLLAWIGWQSCVVSATRLPARSTPLRGGGVTFRPGWRPWSASSFPVQLGLWVAGSCGAVAHLRAVVRRDGGPGRWSVCFATLYRVGDVRHVALHFWRVDFFFVGASRICFSHSIHGVFLSGFGLRSSRLVGCCCVGFSTVVSVLVRFSIN